VQVTEANSEVYVPPVKKSLPVVGDSWALFKHPHQYLLKQEKTYGRVFFSNVFFMNSLFMLEPDAVQFMLRNKDDIFAAAPVYNKLLGKLRSLTSMDFAPHRLHRRLLKPVFNRAALIGYVDQMNASMHVDAGGWEAEPNPSFYTLAEDVSRNIGASVFMGLEDHPDKDKVTQAMMALSDSASSIIRYPLPGNRWNKALKSHGYLQFFFQNLLNQYRHQGSQDRKDMLSVMLQSFEESGEAFTDTEIIDHIKLIVGAAHDTSVSATTTMMYFMIRYPEWQERLREQMLALDQASPDYAALDKLDLTRYVFQEALRILPPIQSIHRTAVKSFKFRGQIYPEGTELCTVPQFLHHLPEFWTEPYQFDPMRFAPGREEHKQHSCLWFPFSAGAHTCIGLQIAEMFSKLLMFHLLTRYRFKAVPGHDLSGYKKEFYGFGRFKNRLPVVIEKL